LVLEIPKKVLFFNNPFLGFPPSYFGRKIIFVKSSRVINLKEIIKGFRYISVRRWNIERQYRKVNLKNSWILWNKNEIGFDTIQRLYFPERNPQAKL
jgi:hypothetical protein